MPEVSGIEVLEQVRTCALVAGAGNLSGGTPTRVVLEMSLTWLLDESEAVGKQIAKIESDYHTMAIVFTDDTALVLETESDGEEDDAYFFVARKESYQRHPADLLRLGLITEEEATVMAQAYAANREAEERQQLAKLLEKYGARP